MRYNITFGLRGNGAMRQVRVRIQIPNNRIEHNLGFSVREESWDDVTQRVKKSCDKHMIYNKIITDISTSAEVYITDCYINKTTPLKEDIKIIICNILNNKGKKNGNIDTLMEEFIYNKSLENSWSHKNIQKWITLKNDIVNWKVNLDVNEINDDTMRSYMERLIDKGHHNTTILRSIQYFKEFLRWCSEKKYYNGNSHNTYKPKIKGLNVKEVIYLELEELDALMNYKPATMYEQEILDVFIFMCFTGLRYSDVCSLSKDDIRNDKIHVVTKKTSDPLIIELNKHSRAILIKYNYILPVHPCQSSNRTLKEIARKCDINSEVRVVYYNGGTRKTKIVKKYELITNHCARRTFVVTSLSLGIPPEVIMQWTGHKNHTSMKPYVKIVSRLKEESMSKYDNI